MQPVVIPRMSSGEMADQNQYFVMREMADSVRMWGGGVIMGLNTDVKVIHRFTSEKQCIGHVSKDRERASPQIIPEAVCQCHLENKATVA